MYIIHVCHPVCLHVGNMTFAVNDVFMFLEGGVIKKSEKGVHSDFQPKFHKVK